MFCPRCGATLDDGSRFCGYCGYQFSEADLNGFSNVNSEATVRESGNGSNTYSATKEPVKPAKSRSPWAIILPVAAVVIAVIFIVVALNSRNSNNTAYEDTAEETAQLVSAEPASTDKPAETKEAKEDKNGKNKPKDILAMQKKAYLDLIKRYESTYGSLYFTDESGWCTEARGLCFADLIDFDKNGSDELIVVYRDESLPIMSGYTVEVWTTDSNGKISCVYQNDPFMKGIEGRSLVLARYEFYEQIIDGDQEVGFSYRKFNGREFEYYYTLPVHEYPDNFYTGGDIIVYELNFGSSEPDRDEQCAQDLRDAVTRTKNALSS